MALINPTIVKDVGFGDGSVVRVIWTPVTEADTCAPFTGVNFSDKSVHVFGTFGGASIAMHGSNDGGANFAALNDPGGTVLAMGTPAKIKAILENTEQIKPVTTGGTSSSLTIAMVCRLSNTLRT